MNSKMILLLVASVLTLSQCTNDNPTPREEPINTIDFSCVEEPTVCDLTNLNSNFAIKAFKNINASEAEQENIFISPFSISTALSMTTNGANGQTLDEMLATLELNSMSLDQINNNYQRLLEVLPALDAQTTLKIANSIWPQSDYPVLPSFLELNSDKYNSEVVPVNFADPAVTTQVNEWIEDKTNGLITDALEQLPPDVVMLLINAIYFKGQWQTEFNIEDTHQANFYGATGTSTVDMMHIDESSFPYFHNDIFQAIDLPYGDSIFSMSVFLPKDGYDVNDIVDELSAEHWAAWTNAFTPQNVELFLPKFKMEYEAKLKENLKAMGMPSAFDFRADFSNMIDGGGVAIDEVIHKTFVEVSEQGTEAAAVTVVVIEENSAPLVPQMKVDRPFFFVIRDQATNSILFMGKCMSV